MFRSKAHFKETSPSYCGPGPPTPAPAIPASGSNDPPATCIARIVSVPPYWGVPNLDHQFPLVAVVVGGGEAVETVACVEGEGSVVEVVVDVVALAQETNINESRMKKLSVNQIIRFFIFTFTPLLIPMQVGFVSG